jgi:hypothetical protein
VYILLSTVKNNGNDNDNDNNIIEKTMLLL